MIVVCIWFRYYFLQYTIRRVRFTASKAYEWRDTWLARENHGPHFLIS